MFIESVRARATCNTIISSHPVSSHRPCIPPWSFLVSLSLVGYSFVPSFSLSFLILLPSHFPPFLAVLFLPLATLSRTFATSIQFCLICSRYPGPPIALFSLNHRLFYSFLTRQTYRLIFLDFSDVSYFISDMFGAVRK